jgi:hypothetical protein
MDYEEIRRMKDKGPYDSFLEDKRSMYDDMPYYRDINVCTAENIGLISGNVLKYYRYKVTDTFFIIPDKYIIGTN